MGCSENKIKREGGGQEREKEEKRNGQDVRNSRLDSRLLTFGGGALPLDFFVPEPPLVKDAVTERFMLKAVIGVLPQFEKPCFTAQSINFIYGCLCRKLQHRRRLLSKKIGTKTQATKVCIIISCISSFMNVSYAKHRMFIFFEFSSFKRVIATKQHYFVPVHREMPVAYKFEVIA